MATLKEELDSLVITSELKSGIINNLATQAFITIRDACKDSAKIGHRILQHVPIVFTGCKGGYEQYRPQVREAVIARLKSEDLTVSLSTHPNAEYDDYITITW